MEMSIMEAVHKFEERFSHLESKIEVVEAKAKESDAKVREGTSQIKKIKEETTGLHTRMKSIESEMGHVAELMSDSRDEIRGLRDDVFTFFTRAFIIVVVLSAIYGLTLAVLLGRGMSAKAFGVEFGSTPAKTIQSYGPSYE